MTIKKISKLYSVRKLRKNEGRIEDKTPRPIVAPQTGAPAPQACRAASPKAAVIVPRVETL